MEIDGTTGHGNGLQATDVFPDWEKLVQAWWFELLLWKGLYSLLCRAVSLQEGSGGIAELTNEIADFVGNIPGIRQRCAVVHVAIGSTLGNLMRVDPEGCFFDYDDERSVRRLLRRLAIRYLKQTVFVKYDD